jgi:putative transcriptional regulator
MIRFFAGYAGWEPSSVEEEVEVKTWMLPTFNREIVFSKEPKDLWRTVLRSMGGGFRSLSADDPNILSLN